MGSWGTAFTKGHARYHNMTADTGCQSVLVGIKIIHRLGFKKWDLIPVKTKMSAVNRDVIPILGAVIQRLSRKSGSGKVIQTAQKYAM